MKVNNQISNKQNYNVAFQGKNNKKNHLIRNTIILGSAGALVGGTYGFVMHNKIKDVNKSSTEMLLNDGIITKEAAEKHLAQLTSRFKIAKFTAKRWAIVTTVGYLTYRLTRYLVGHLIKRNHSN